jgi:hypothetical protein
MLTTTGVVFSGALRSAGYASAAACSAAEMQKNEAVLIDDRGGLAKKGNQEKKTMEPFSLSRRGRLKSF